MYCVVNFKGDRADVYIRSSEVTFPNDIHHGDLVMVEADRGYDIGQVIHTTFDRGEAEHAATRRYEKFLNNLLRFSRLLNAQQQTHRVPVTLTPLEPNAHPSRIKRIAPQYEYMNLVRKEHSETKAKRSCQDKAIEHNLNMEILDVEFQS